MAFLADTLVHPFEINTVLQGAVLNEIFVRDLRITRSHAVGEAEVDLRIWIDASSTKLDHVSETFAGPMHARNSIRLIINPVHFLALVSSCTVIQPYFPIYDSLKSTLSLTLSMVGTTSCWRQSRASGHFDMICASRLILFVSENASSTVSETGSSRKPLAGSYRPCEMNVDRNKSSSESVRSAAGRNLPKSTCRNGRFSGL